MKRTMATLALLGGGSLSAQVTPNDLMWVVKDLDPNPGIRWNAGFAAVPTLQHHMTWFGGVNFITLYQETWTYNGSRWIQILGPGPSARCHQFQSGFRDSMMLYGGETDVLNTARKNDTWLFDGSGWTEVVTTNRPGRRCCGGMVWDTARDVVVLYGGSKQNGEWPEDTWEFDGSDWDASCDRGTSWTQQRRHRLRRRPGRDRDLRWPEPARTIAERHLGVQRSLVDAGRIDRAFAHPAVGTGDDLSRTARLGVDVWRRERQLRHSR